MFQLPPTHKTAGNLTVYQHTDGKPYLVKQQPDGAVTFTPLEVALSQLQQHQTQAQPMQRSPAGHDPFALLLTGIAIAGLAAIVVYFIGFLAGAHGRETVIVPRSPVCSTHRSSFLFWSDETKECQ